MILRLYLEAEIVTRAIVATLILKIFPGEHAPGPPRWVRRGARARLRRDFRSLSDKGPMLHSDPGPTNSLRGPVLQVISNFDFHAPKSAILSGHLTVNFSSAPEALDNLQSF